MSKESLEQFADKLIVVLVLYKMDLKASPSFKTLSNSLIHFNIKLDLVVYDNSPETKKNSTIDTYEHWNIHYIKDSSNPGVSKAYNTGFKLGRELLKDWLLIVDQDTQFPKDAFNMYYIGINKYINISLFSPILRSDEFIVSPARYLFKRGFAMKQVKPGMHSLSFLAPVNSGLLISLSAYEQTGGYKESIKLDFSDFYFISKLKKIYKKFVVLELVCHHGISTLDNSDLNSALNRFNYYCEGAFFASENSFDKLIYYLITFLRALSLTKKFKKTIFINAHFNF